MAFNGLIIQLIQENLRFKRITNTASAHEFLSFIRFIVEAAFCHCSFTSSCIKGRFNTTSWLSCLSGWSLASCQIAVATPQGRRFNHCFIEWRQRAHGKTADGRWYKEDCGSHLYFSLSLPSSEVFTFGAPPPPASTGFVGCMDVSTSWVSGTLLRATME